MNFNEKLKSYETDLKKLKEMFTEFYYLSKKWHLENSSTSPIKSLRRHGKGLLMSHELNHLTTKLIRLGGFGLGQAVNIRLIEAEELVRSRLFLVQQAFRLLKQWRKMGPHLC